MELDVEFLTKQRGCFRIRIAPLADGRRRLTVDFPAEDDPQRLVQEAVAHLICPDKLDAMGRKHGI